MGRPACQTRSLPSCPAGEVGARGDHGVEVQVVAVDLARQDHPARVQRRELPPHPGDEARVGGEVGARRRLGLQHAGMVGHVGAGAAVPFGIGEAARPAARARRPAATGRATGAAAWRRVSVFCDSVRWSWSSAAFAAFSWSSSSTMRLMFRLSAQDMIDSKRWTMKLSRRFGLVALLAPARSCGCAVGDGGGLASARPRAARRRPVPRARRRSQIGTGA